MEWCSSRFKHSHSSENIFDLYEFDFECMDNLVKKFTNGRKEGECLMNKFCPVSCRGCEYQEEKNRIVCPRCDSDKKKYWDFNKLECLQSPNGGK